MTTAKIVNRYRKIAAITVVAVVFLILVGGLVRMTGSGMGCPDWPKCFGKWVPPTDISQLPEDYKTRFQVAGKMIADFDPFKTWVEYINRLIGVLIGFFAILTVVAAFPLRKLQKNEFRLSLLGLIAIIIQGLIGAYVVRTHLEVGIVTLHMVIALIIMGVYIVALLYSYRPELASLAEKTGVIPSGIILVGLVVVVVTMVQIVLGTQVRESVDRVAEQMGEESRETWIQALGRIYEVHRFFYYLVVASWGLWLYQMREWVKQPGIIQTLMLSSVGVLVLEIILGLGMHHLAIPAIFQPLHLVMATVLLGIELGLVGIMLLLNKEKR
ncbi:MAG: COX15/CtaA family protein [Bacteroidia bacterium]|nr:COX15/CtaA family protein [Bacteroidia bacterium]